MWQEKCSEHQNPFSNMRGSGQENDSCQKGREEKYELGEERERERREMEGEQSEKGRMEEDGTYLLYTYCNHHGPTYTPFCLSNLSPRSAVCPEGNCRDSGSWVIV